MAPIAQAPISARLAAVSGPLRMLRICRPTPDSYLGEAHRRRRLPARAAQPFGPPEKPGPQGVVGAYISPRLRILIGNTHHPVSSAGVCTPHLAWGRAIIFVGRRTAAPRLAPPITIPYISPFPPRGFGASVTDPPTPCLPSNSPASAISRGILKIQPLRIQDILREILKFLTPTARLPKPASNRGGSQRNGPTALNIGPMSKSIVTSYIIDNQRN